MSAAQRDLTIASGGTSLTRRHVPAERIVAALHGMTWTCSRAEKNVTKHAEDTWTAERIHLGLGFHQVDRELVVSTLAALNRHLDRWRPESVDVHVSVKGRDGQEQCVTLEIRLPRRPPLVVHVGDPNIDRALVEARKRMIRELEEVRSAMKARRVAMA